mmetsp:Transcript_66574/g.152558  ORF Transcript_66574/g.152558 Transcript_66574/m.152558 type:complete len:100 (+) Transcript_66574:2-301(+)
MMLARRALPRQRALMADRIAQRREKAERKAYIAQLLTKKPTQVADETEDDKVIYLVASSPANETLAKALLTLCEWDMPKALGLARASESAEPETSPPLL